MNWVVDGEGWLESRPGEAKDIKWGQIVGNLTVINVLLKIATILQANSATELKECLRTLCNGLLWNTRVQVTLLK